MIRWSIVQQQLCFITSVFNQGNIIGVGVLYSGDSDDGVEE